MFTITENNEVQFNGRTVKQCSNESVALQTAIHLSVKFGQLAEFQVEEILFSQEVK